MSNIKLLAIAPFDGWAYILDRDKYYLIRPPYKDLSNKISVENDDVEEALMKHDFYQSSKSFHNYMDLILYLIEYKKELREKLNIDSSPINLNDIVEFYKRASIEQLDDLYSKISIEVNKDYPNIEIIEFINRILSLENIQCESKYTEKFVALKLLSLEKKEKKEKELKQRFRDIDPTMMVKAMSRQKEISDSHCVMMI